MFHLVPDKKTNIKIDNAKEAGTITVVEGSRALANCDDQAEDMALKGNSRQNTINHHLFHLFKVTC